MKHTPKEKIVEQLAEAIIEDLVEREQASNESLWDRAKELAVRKFGAVPTAKGYKWAKKWYHYKGGKWTEPSKNEQLKRLKKLLAEINAVSAGGGGLQSTGLVVMGNKNTWSKKKQDKAKEKMWSNYKRNEEKR